ncbi:MAG TPA: MBL fold metallo-hydrolase [Bryobacteraceae bacterium]|nr:MBL fold metallo-hydrolase [Bryobacteraceae bacterium]
MGLRSIVLLALTTSLACAQDARSVLETAARTMGAENLKSIEYSGSGWDAAVGQSYNLTSDWPRVEVSSYMRVIDYGAMTSREERTRRQGNNPTQGRNPLAEEHVTALLADGFAWNLRGDAVLPQPGRYLEGPPVAELRQLEIILTPHGFLKAALASGDATAISQPIIGPSDAGLSGNGRKVTIVSFKALGKYRVNATINDHNLVELVTTWIPNPVYGDMLYEYRYTQYRDFGGIQFPGLIHVHMGDPVLNPAHNIYEIKVSEVKPNVEVAAMPVPEAVRQATVAPVHVESQKLADGVWLLGGGTHNSVLVEFKDFVAVVEAPLNEARSLAVIEEVNRLAPDKPIRYVINTHHHFDHAGGLRTYLAQGTTVVTHESNKDYYLAILFHPGGWTLQPDRLATYYPMFMVSRRPAPIETVDAKNTISDGVRNMDIDHLQDVAYALEDPSYRQGNHAADMLMVYLPKEKILINADLYSPPAPGRPLPAATPGMRTLYQNMRLEKLDVERHVPIHGRVGTNEEFLKIVGKTAEGTSASR